MRNIGRSGVGVAVDVSVSRSPQAAPCKPKIPSIQTDPRRNWQAHAGPSAAYCRTSDASRHGPPGALVARLAMALRVLTRVRGFTLSEIRPNGRAAAGLSELACGFSQSGAVWSALSMRANGGSQTLAVEMSEAADGQLLLAGEGARGLAVDNRSSGWHESRHCAPSTGSRPAASRRLRDALPPTSVRKVRPGGVDCFAFALPIHRPVSPVVCPFPGSGAAHPSTA